MKAWTDISWGYNVLSQTKAPLSSHCTKLQWVLYLADFRLSRLRRLGSRQCSCERRSLLYFCTFDCLGVAQWPLIPMPYIYICICSTEKKHFVLLCGPLCTAAGRGGIQCAAETPLCFWKRKKRHSELIPISLLTAFRCIIS